MDRKNIAIRKLASATATANDRHVLIEAKNESLIKLQTITQMLADYNVYQVKYGDMLQDDRRKSTARVTFSIDGKENTETIQVWVLYMEPQFATDEKGGALKNDESAKPYQGLVIVPVNRNAENNGWPMQAFTRFHSGFYWPLGIKHDGYTIKNMTLMPPPSSSRWS